MLFRGYLERSTLLHLATATLVIVSLLAAAVPTAAAEATSYPVLLRAIDGTELDGTLTVPTGTPNRVAILITHGASGNYASSVPGWMGPEAATYGYTTLALNRRDHDDQNFRTLFEDGLFDIRVGIDYLENLGYSQVFLAGHSKGTTYLPSYNVLMGDSRVAGIGLFAAVDDSALQQRLLIQGPFFESNLARAQAAYDAGRGKEYLDFQTVFGQPIRLSAHGFLSYFGPNAIGVPVRMIPWVRVPVLLVRSSTDTQFTPDANHTRLLALARAAGVRADYLTIDDPVAARPPALGHGFVGVEQATMAATADWISRNIPGATLPAGNVRRPA